jgi:hypothetical protein
MARAKKKATGDIGAYAPRPGEYQAGRSSRQVAMGAAREGTARDPIPRRAGTAQSTTVGRGGVAGIAKGTSQRGSVGPSRKAMPKVTNPSKRKTGTPQSKGFAYGRKTS